MDWEELERRPKSDNMQSQMKIQTKKVAVRRDQIRKLPDGTTIVVSDSDARPQRDIP